MEYLKKSIKALTAKLQTDKKTMLVIILGIAGIIMLVISELIPSSSPEKKESGEKTETALSCSDYEKCLEERLQKIISEIDGAGSVSVMITLDSGNENVYAQEQKQGGGENRSYENEYVIIKTDDGENTVLIKNVQPEIRGVAVVCSGGGSAVVRQNITNAVTAVLGISSARVNISAMKKNNGG